MMSKKKKVTPKKTRSLQPLSIMIVGLNYYKEKWKIKK
jgi:hypothetical protein